MSILNKSDEEIIRNFRLKRNLEIKINASLELSLDMGKGLNENHRTHFNYQHFYNDLPYTKEVYLIAYDIEQKEPITGLNILKKIWDINCERNWEDPIKLGVVTGLGKFDDFSKFKQEEWDKESYKETLQQNMLKQKHLVDRFNKHFTPQLKTYINSVKTTANYPAGFYFYPNLHSKIYFSDRLIYLGSANPKGGTLVNAEGGITTSDEDVMKFVSSYYLALVRESISLNDISLPEGSDSMIQVNIPGVIER